MRLPNVLLIGAMKAGTTSLYMDLAEHPDVALVDDKEPHALCRDDVLDDAGLQKYASIYGKSNEDILLDASTGYSKLPDETGVVERALQVLPEGFRVIYLVREPVSRIVSQHYHEYSRGEVPSDINQVVRDHSRLVDYSRYGFQLAPWIEAVGLDRVCVVRFEDYTDRRQETVDRVFEFLGLPPQADQIDLSRVYNKSQGKPVRNKYWTLVYNNSLYRSILRPLLPVKLRMLLGKLLLPKAPERPEPPTEDTVQWLREQLAADVALLSRLLGRETPLWSEFEALIPPETASAATD